MEQSCFKEKFVNKLENFLKDRMEVYDKFRLKENESSISLEEVYHKYKQLVLDSDKNLRIPSYKDSVPIGQSVLFTEVEKEELFRMIHEYLINVDIKDYPSPRGSFCSLIIDILYEILSSYTKNKAIMEKEKVKKYIVSLNCIYDFLEFTDDFSDFICNESNRFYINDYTGNTFLNFNYEKDNTSEYYISEYLQLITNENLKVFSLREKKNKKNIVIFGTDDNQIYYNFINGQSCVKKDYDLDYSLSMHEYLKLQNCLFLEQEIYDGNNIAIITQSINRFNSMSEEEQESLDRIAKEAAKFILERYEIFKFSDNYCQSLWLTTYDDSKEEIYELGKKEKIFIETLKNEIKAKLLQKDLVHLNLEFTSTGVMRRVFNKSDLYFSALFEEVYITLKQIFFQNVYNNKQLIYNDQGDYNRKLSI